jgi:hypothetical protein
MLNQVRETFAPPQRIVGLTELLAAADDDLIVTSANMKVGAYTVAAQPGTPSKISATVTAVDTADTMGTLTIVGTDTLDRALTETVTLVADSTVWTSGYFKTITSITGAGWVIDGAEGTEDTIEVGVAAESGWLINGASVTVVNMSGNIWVNPLDTAVADATALKLTEGMAWDLFVMDLLSLISDGSGATYQIIVHGQTGVR